MQTPHHREDDRDSRDLLPDAQGHCSVLYWLTGPHARTGMGKETES